MFKSKTNQPLRASRTAHLPSHKRDFQLASLVLDSEQAFWDASYNADLMNLDVLQWEKINIYREYIEQMRPTEITQAYAESQDQPVWREALEICAPLRLHQLIKSGDVTAIEASERLDRQIQKRKANGNS